MLNNILIVVVVYNRPVSEIKFLKSMSLLSHSPDILVYDNSLVSQRMIDDGISIGYYHNVGNPGVSTAYNFSFEYARSAGKSLVLILDQDTDFDARYLSVYISKYMQYGNEYIYAPIICDAAKSKIYSPAMLNKFIGKAIPYQKLSGCMAYNLTGKSVINSGLMIPLLIFEKINGFNEKIKLDFSDIYFIEKYKELNPSVILVPIEMEHGLSGDEQPDKEKELHRFKYYCNGAKELARSLDVSTTYTCLRRMLRLMIKYYTIQPVITYIKYYLGEAKV